MKEAVKGSRIIIIHPDDPLCGATAIVTDVNDLGVGVTLLTIPKGITKWTPGDSEFFEGGYAIWEDMESAWDFVERYYYKYHNCSDIAHSDDLCKIIDEEYDDEDDCAYQVLQRDYGGARELNLERIKDDYNRVMIKIYESAFDNYIELNKV